MCQGVYAMDGVWRGWVYPMAVRLARCAGFKANLPVLKCESVEIGAKIRLFFLAHFSIGPRL